MVYIHIKPGEEHSDDTRSRLAMEAINADRPEILPRIKDQVKLLQDDVCQLAITAREGDVSGCVMADGLATMFRHLLAMKISLSGIDDILVAHFGEDAERPDWLITFWHQLDGCESALDFYVGEFDEATVGFMDDGDYEDDDEDELDQFCDEEKAFAQAVYNGFTMHCANCGDSFVLHVNPDGAEDCPAAANASGGECKEMNTLVIESDNKRVLDIIAQVAKLFGGEPG